MERGPARGFYALVRAYVRARARPSRAPRSWNVEGPTMRNVSSRVYAPRREGRASSARLPEFGPRGSTNLRELFLPRNRMPAEIPPIRIGEIVTIYLRAHLRNRKSRYVAIDAVEILFFLEIRVEFDSVDNSSV